jgi:ribonuclease-3
LLGKSDENNNVRNKVSTKEDLFEAILGAVALDCDFDIMTLYKVSNVMLNAKPKTSNSINKKVQEMRKEVGKPKMETAVSKLNELNQKGYISKPKYIFENVNSGWKCTCKVTECEHNWTNKSPQDRKSEAKQIAAKGMLDDILGYKD